ncbi:hypothetical protein FJU08_05365 [Martelella alba]|uniref:Uncharacterized protein n=1 Tax=Martelella alba TaxID=2590451 RepID=A0A506UH64_9HYPH|nr:hypothetical protein [Martelella alba]TPW32427.1 hypothetical protein FJU08_05365 [Martelella alba]
MGSSSSTLQNDRTAASAGRRADDSQSIANQIKMQAVRERCRQGAAEFKQMLESMSDEQYIKFHRGNGIKDSDEKILSTRTGASTSADPGTTVPQSVTGTYQEASANVMSFAGNDSGGSWNEAKETPSDQTFSASSTSQKRHWNE